MHIEKLTLGLLANSLIQLFLEIWNKRLEMIPKRQSKMNFKKVSKAKFLIILN